MNETMHQAVGTARRHGKVDKLASSTWIQFSDVSYIQPANPPDCGMCGDCTFHRSAEEQAVAGLHRGSGRLLEKRPESSTAPQHNNNICILQNFYWSFHLQSTLYAR